MNLVIDHGNTTVKFAVFSSYEMIDRIVEDDLSINTLKKIFKQYNSIDRAILSSVRLLNREIILTLENHLKYFLILDANTSIPLKNSYTSKDTLGYDRIADAVGAHTIFPGKNVLVIDIGTAITYDLVTSEGEFSGGNISPGMEVRFKALNQFTGKLPLVDPQPEFPMLGKSTHEAILSGVIKGIIFEMEGYIHEITYKYPDLKVVLTGGDAKFFEKTLKNIIFVDLNLTLSGLNRILEYNAK